MTSQKDEELFENRTEDEELGPLEVEKRKNRDAQRDKNEREEKDRRTAPPDADR